MARPVKTPRTYDSSRRKEQARRNRLAVLEAARSRFIAEGFAATTMSDIAADAGVSVESVYKMFGTKSGLLKPIFDITIAGDDEPTPMAERESIVQIIEEPDVMRKIDLYVALLQRTRPRTGPVNVLIRDAAGADAVAADTFRATRGEYLTAMTMAAENLHSTGRLKTTKNETRDILWTVCSPEVFELLVLERKWSLRRYGAFVASTLKNALL